MTTLILDFDGTIADSFDKALEIFNSITPSLKCDIVDPKQKMALRKMRSHEILHQLGIPNWKIPQTLLEMRKQLKQHLADIPPCPHIQAVLQHCQKRNYYTGILSSNSVENIEHYFDIHKLPTLQFIHSESSLFGKHRPLKKILRTTNNSTAIYIGDETRDIEAAQKAGCKSIAVSWGFCHQDVLKQSHPDCIANTASELIDAIENLASQSSEA